MEINPVLSVVLRWVHISCVVILIGSIFYARFYTDDLARGFRGWIITAITGLILSGFYTLITKPEIPPGYHMWFGIKMLLALHVFAVSFLLSTPAGDAAKRKRWMSGIVYSAFTIIAISSYLRWISIS